MRTVREAVLALLNDHADTLTHRSGQFLGQIAASLNPLSERLAKMLERAGLSPLADGGEL